MTEATEQSASDQLNQAAQTAEQLAPAAIAVASIAAAASGNPEAIAAVKVAPIAIAALQSLTQLANVGALSQEQLAQMFADVGASVQTSHSAWAAMDKPAL